jgi:hypothetical protein
LSAGKGFVSGKQEKTVFEFFLKPRIRTNEPKILNHRWTLINTDKKGGFTADAETLRVFPEAGKLAAYSRSQPKFGLCHDDIVLLVMAQLLCQKFPIHGQLALAGLEKTLVFLILRQFCCWHC